MEFSNASLFLKNISIFHGLEDDDFQLIAERSDEASIPEGGVIFREADRGTSFFMIYHGKVRITRKHNKKEKQLAILKKYSCFGDTDLVLNRWRSATATALTDLSLLVIHAREFRQLYQEISYLKHRRRKRFIFIIIPHTIGKFVLDILGRDKPSETTAVISGWIIIIGSILLTLDIVSPTPLIDIWNSLSKSVAK